MWMMTYTVPEHVRQASGRVINILVNLLSHVTTSEFSWSLFLATPCSSCSHIWQKLKV